MNSLDNGPCGEAALYQSSCRCSPLGACYMQEVSAIYRPCDRNTLWNGKLPKNCAHFQSLLCRSGSGGGVSLLPRPHPIMRRLQYWSAFQSSNLMGWIRVLLGQQCICAYSCVQLMTDRRRTNFAVVREVLHNNS